MIHIFFRPFFWSSHSKTIYWISFMYPLATVFGIQDVRGKVTLGIIFTSIALTWLVRKGTDRKQPSCSYWWILAPDLTLKGDRYISIPWKPIVSCRILSFSVYQPNLGDSWCNLLLCPSPASLRDSYLLDQIWGSGIWIVNIFPGRMDEKMQPGNDSSAVA